MITRLIATVVLATVAVGATACSSATETPPPSSDTLPAWIDEVTPRPGAAYAPDSGVSVRYQLPSIDQEVRLIIDGVDVTSVSTEGPDLLRYDTSQGIIDLNTGDHRAEARLVILSADGVETVPVDTYTWTFRLA